MNQVTFNTRLHYRQATRFNLMAASGIHHCPALAGQIDQHTGLTTQGLIEWANNFRIGHRLISQRSPKNLSGKCFTGRIVSATIVFMRHNKRAASRNGLALTDIVKSLDQATIVKNCQTPSGAVPCGRHTVCLPVDSGFAGSIGKSHCVHLPSFRNST